MAAVLQRQADAGVTWTSGTGDQDKGYSRGNLRRMVDLGRLDMSDLRILWTSELIPADPQVVRKDLPQEAKEIYRDLLLNLAERDRRCFERMVGGQAQAFKRSTMPTRTSSRFGAKARMAPDPDRRARMVI